MTRRSSARGIPGLMAIAWLATFASPSASAQIPEGTVAALTVEEMLGQTLLVGVDAGNNVDASVDGLVGLIRKYKIGNVILFKHNFPSQRVGAHLRSEPGSPRIDDEIDVPRRISEITRRLQRAAFDALPPGRRMPLLIAVDQEGGGNTRVELGVARVPGAPFLGATRDRNRAYQAGAMIGREMRQLGFNMVLAPVADINNLGANDIMSGRAFGSHVDIVTPLASSFASGIRSAGVLAIAKHFPGHGRSSLDPHCELGGTGYQDVSEFEKTDLKPFEELAKLPVDGMLTAHVLASPIDKMNPVTTSSTVVSRWLRQRLGFQGLVITDDLVGMRSILLDRERKQPRDLAATALAAYGAGHDMVLLGTVSLDPTRGGLSLRQLDRFIDRLLTHFRDTGGDGDLRARVERIVAAKRRLYPTINSRHLDSWQPPFQEGAYRDALQRDRVVASEIARDASVLISEDGAAINDIKSSRYFGEGKGPLGDGIPLGPQDRIVLASPVFSPPDSLDETIRRALAANRPISTVRMVYGWASQQALAEAGRQWKEPVERLSSIQNCQVSLNDAAVDRKALQVIKASESAKLLLFGVVAREHARVLRRTLDLWPAETPKPKVVVLCMTDPYVIEKSTYEDDHVSVLYLPAQPDSTVAGDLLFGRSTPKPIGYLPSEAPGMASRAAVGVPVQSPDGPNPSPTPGGGGSEPPGTSSQLLACIAGGLAGSTTVLLLLWASPKRNLRPGAAPVVSLLLLGAVAGAVVHVLLPLAAGRVVGGVLLPAAFSLPERAVGGLIAAAVLLYRVFSVPASATPRTPAEPPAPPEQTDPSRETAPTDHLLEDLLESPPQPPLEPAPVAANDHGAGRRPQVVLLVHGIRTQAEWQDRIRQTLISAGVDDVLPVKYGYFDAFRFWSPLKSMRARPIARVERELRAAVAAHPDCEFSILAHSFGTYSVGSILEEHPEIRIHRLALCGAILPRDFRWDRLRGQVGEVVNDCGARDVWPVLADALSWGYGASGTHGFGAVLVRDRFHACGHSDFFSDTFATSYWAPFFVEGRLVEPDYAGGRPRSPLWMSLLAARALRWALGLLAVGGLVAWRYLALR